MCGNVLTNVSKHSNKKMVMSVDFGNLKIGKELHANQPIDTAEYIRVSSNLLQMYCITGIASLKQATADVFVYTISALLPEFLCFCWCCKISWHSSSKIVSVRSRYIKIGYRKRNLKGTKRQYSVPISIA